MAHDPHLAVPNNPNFFLKTGLKLETLGYGEGGTPVILVHLQELVPGIFQVTLIS